MNDTELNKKGATIYVKNNNMTVALRKLKKLVQSERIFQEHRAKAYYEKPSEKKKREKAAAVKRWRKKEAEINRVL